MREKYLNITENFVIDKIDMTWDGGCCKRESWVNLLFEIIIVNVYFMFHLWKYCVPKLFLFSDNV